MRPASRAPMIEVSACHQTFDALVDVPEPLLQPYDRLAVRREAEMARLDDSCVDGTDRDLVKARSLGWEKWIRDAIGRSFDLDRPADASRPNDRGPATRADQWPPEPVTEEVGNGALEPDGGGVSRPD